MKILSYSITVILIIALSACIKKADVIPGKQATDSVYILPVVVHIIYTGEEIGQEYNLSKERIIEQVETLNNDFRKQEGTLGYNTHALGTDAQIEFRLAEIDPDGNMTDGINRINANDIVYESDTEKVFFDYLPYYSYWDKKAYINIWVVPVEPNLILGQSSIPLVDIPGLKDSDTTKPSGIMIGSPHFGSSSIEGGANLGRTLTHEMGHFLGLEHLWGKTENAHCMDYDDYCDDTPFVSKRTRNCEAQEKLSCIGDTLLTHNYMDYKNDACMNMFTKDQVARMRFVLKNSEDRKALTIASTITR